MDDTLKKILKIAAFGVAAAAAITGVCLLVSKLVKCKKEKDEEEIEEYVSCSCCDDEPIVVADEEEPQAEAEE